jgi:hypothetical protein
MDASPPSPEPPPDLAQLSEQLNETLRLGGAASAEQAFGLSCSIGLLPILGILLVLFLFKVINLILGLILLVMCLLAMVGLGMLAAQQARQGGIRRTYTEGVEAEIRAYLVQTGLTRPQFDALVSGYLPAGAPLQAFLSTKEGT